jgi:hypothetical protein
MSEPKVPAEHFVQLLSANVDNRALSDEAFRQFVRNSLSVVQSSTAPRQHVASSQFDDAPHLNR